MWQMWQMPNIWHICHTKHKKHLSSDVVYVLKFATVQTQMVSQNIVFYSVSPLISGLHFFSLFSHSFFSHQTQLLPQQRKNKMTHSTSSNNKLQGKVVIITSWNWWLLGLKWWIVLVVAGFGLVVVVWVLAGFHDGDQVWVTVEIGFGYGSLWRLCLRSILGFSYLSLFSHLGVGWVSRWDRVCVTMEIRLGYGSRWRLCLRSVLGFSCLSLFSRLGFNSGGSWCFSGGAVAWIDWGLGWIGCEWWVFWLGLNRC